MLRFSLWLLRSVVRCEVFSIVCIIGISSSAKLPSERFGQHGSRLTFRQVLRETTCVHTAVQTQRQRRYSFSEEALGTRAGAEHRSSDERGRSGFPMAMTISKD